MAPEFSKHTSGTEEPFVNGGSEDTLRLPKDVSSEGGRQVIETIGEGDSTDAAPLTASEVYFRDDFGKPHLTAALRIIHDAASESNLAIEALQGGDILESNDRVNHVRVALREAFDYRSATGSDGFGILLVSALWSLQNLGPEPASIRQLICVRRVLRTMLERPYLSSEDAAEVTLELEDEELNPLPPMTPELGGLLAE